MAGISLAGLFINAEKLTKIKSHDDFFVKINIILNQQ
jgi:hypothetical protein